MGVELVDDDGKTTDVAELEVGRADEAAAEPYTSISANPALPVVAETEVTVTTRRVVVTERGSVTIVADPSFTSGPKVTLVPSEKERVPPRMLSLRLGRS